MRTLTPKNSRRSYQSRKPSNAFKNQKREAVDFTALLIDVLTSRSITFHAVMLLNVYHVVVIEDERRGVHDKIWAQAEEYAKRLWVEGSEPVAALQSWAIRYLAPSKRRLTVTKNYRANALALTLINFNSEVTADINLGFAHALGET